MGPMACEFVMVHREFLAVPLHPYSGDRFERSRRCDPAGVPRNLARDAEGISIVARPMADWHWDAGADRSFYRSRGRSACIPGKRYMERYPFRTGGVSAGSVWFFSFRGGQRYSRTGAPLSPCSFNQFFGKCLPAKVSLFFIIDRAIGRLPV